MTDTTLLLPNQYLLYINNVSMTIHVDVKRRLRFCIKIVFDMLDGTESIFFIENTCICS
jgi:hypothetical protein